MKDFIKNYNVSKSKIAFHEYGTMRWSLEPNIDFPDKSKFSLDWKTDFINKDIEIIIKVDGKELTLFNNRQSMIFELKK